ncbi:uncharacterized protein [Antedon mediterranea]|uniref:uncharacterized protein isoform X1 n=2 Tax=Antedon mediterranea TaxID=105859 RepID=UPI003AF69D2B
MSPFSFSKGNACLSSYLYIIFQIGNMNVQASKLYLCLVVLCMTYKVFCQFTQPDKTLTIYGTDVDVCSNTHLCQEEDKCGSSPSEARECRCDTECEYYGDCCYDYWSACTSEPNPSIVSMSNQLECFEGDDSFSDGYYIIAFCKDDSTVDTDTIQKCENPGSGDVFLAIIVSDKENNIYKNVYCALCNGVSITDVIAWEVSYLCSDDEVRVEFGEDPTGPVAPGPVPGPVPAPDPSLPTLPPLTTLPPITTEAPPPNIHEQINDGTYCPFMSFRPPSGKQDTRRPCLATAVSQCSASYMNESVIEACLTNYKAIVYGGTVYRNPHCAICNDEPSYNCDVFVTSPSRVGFTSLTVIVDFSDQSSISVSSEYGSYTNGGVSCSTGEVFDPFTNQCLQLTCKDGFTLEGSTCVVISIETGCIKNAIHITSEIFCECKLQQQSLQIEYEYDFEVDNFTTVVEFTNSLTTFDIEYTNQSSNAFNKTIIIISIEQMNCQLVYDISELVVRGINNNTDAQLNVVTFRQNCSTKAIPNELLCEQDRFLLTANETLEYDNVTKKIHVDNSSLQIPDEQYVLEIVHELGNESSVCSILSVSTCNVCPQIQLSIEAFEEQVNGTLVYKTTGDVFQKHQYMFTNTSNSSLLVCSFLNQNGETEENTEFFHYSGALLIISVVGTIISLISLLITILLRVFIAELRTLSGKIILNVSISLFIALLLTLIQGNFTQWPTFCEVMSVFLHYMWLVCFCWMNSMAIELFQTFRTVRSSSRSSRSSKSQRKSFIKYFIYSWGLPAIYVAIIVGISLCECTSLDVMYGDDNVCWIRDELASLYVFGIPLAVILVPNLILFVATIKGLRKSMKSTAAVRSGKSDQDQQTGEMIIYIRISTVMGLTWIFGYVASFVDHVIFWYIFTILNSLQGLFIFIAFNINYSMNNLIKHVEKSKRLLRNQKRQKLYYKRTKNLLIQIQRVRMNLNHWIQRVYNDFSTGIMDQLRFTRLSKLSIAEAMDLCSNLEHIRLDD